MKKQLTQGADAQDDSTTLLFMDTQDKGSPSGSKDTRIERRPSGQYLMSNSRSHVGSSVFLKTKSKGRLQQNLYNSIAQEDEPFSETETPKTSRFTSKFIYFCKLCVVFLLLSTIPMVNILQKSFETQENQLIKRWQENYGEYKFLDKLALLS